MFSQIPLATISYNTDAFLINRLNELIASNIIDMWNFINHKGEMKLDIDSGELVRRDDHKHLIVYPSSRVDTHFLTEQLLEPVPGELPLGCNGDWRKETSTALLDYYPYILHHPVYLKKKHITREFHYNISDVISSHPKATYRIIQEALENNNLLAEQNIINMITSSDEDFFIKAGNMIEEGYLCMKDMNGFRNMVEILDKRKARIYALSEDVAPVLPENKIE